MPDEIVSGTSPLVTEPEVLGPEQLKPVSMSISEQLKHRGTTTVMQGTKRGPGRPPGSGKKQESTDDGDATKKARDDEATRRAMEAKRNRRKSKVNEYTERIVEEGNDYIMQMLVSSGVPLSAIYKPGAAPTTVTVSAKYTELGNQLAVKPMQARAVANFLVDLEESDTGMRVANAFSGGGIGLAFKGIAAGAAVFSYVRGVYQVQQRLAPLLEQAKAYQAASKVDRDAQVQQQVGVM